MHLPSRPALLARLRRSTRFATWVLLVFVLKIGMASACVKHDLAESGLGDAIPAHAALVDSAPAGDDAGSADIIGSCAHCACHHATAFPAGVHTVIPAFTERLAAGVLLPPATEPVHFELRPPIA